MTDELDLSELCALVDVTPRTVHFYVQQGLLPGPDGTGRGAKYGQRHVVRLRLIKRLQREHLPLAEIRRRLDTLTDEEAEALLARTQSESAARASALDYVQSVLRRDSSDIAAAVTRTAIPVRDAHARARERSDTLHVGPRGSERRHRAAHPAAAVAIAKPSG